MKNVRFSILGNTIGYVYPFETTKTILFQTAFPNVSIESMTEEEIDDFICSLIKKHPYIDNSMSIKFSIMKNNSFYHSLSFKNDNYDKQEKGSLEIKYANENMYVCDNIGKTTTKFSSFEDIENLVNKLVQNELRYDTDNITNDGWNYIEEIAPVKAMEFVKSNYDVEDLEYLSKNEIEDIFNQVLSNSSCKLRVG